ncbi:MULTISPECIES: trypco2 family protein [unclassified Streptomyces]|uniref:trypco2 family protein n=1 Tax=unclassified Streptomyces TaxID=2593676 RepID=UPI0036E4C303
MPDEVWVGLAEAVRGVRAELQAAMAAGRDESLRFEVGPVELEFAVDVRKERAGDATAKVFVLSAGGSASKATSDAHRLKITLQPTDVHGRPAKVSSRVDELPAE